LNAPEEPVATGSAPNLARNLRLLRLPPDVSTYALMPIGYPQGKFGPLARKPVSEVAYADRWGVAWPN